MKKSQSQIAVAETSENNCSTIEKKVSELVEELGAENLGCKFERIFDLAAFHSDVTLTKEDIAGLFFLKQLYTILQGKVINS